MYIDFGNTPVKEGIKPNPIFSCKDCIHRIFIPGGLCRCSITNKYLYYDQKFNEECINKNTDNGKRKYILGLFCYNNLGDTTWTGILTYGEFHNCNDSDAFIEVEKANNAELSQRVPNFNNIVLLYCIIAESRDGKPFIPRTEIIPEPTLREIIADANRRFV
jgi:hypothetical protein